MNKEILPVFDANGNPLLTNSFYRLDGVTYWMENGRAIPGGVWLCHCGFNQDKEFTLPDIDGKLFPATEKEKNEWERLRNGMMRNFSKYGCD